MSATFSKRPGLAEFLILVDELRLFGERPEVELLRRAQAAQAFWRRAVYLAITRSGHAIEL